MDDHLQQTLRGSLRLGCIINLILGFHLFISNKQTNRDGGGLHKVGKRPFGLEARNRHQSSNDEAPPETLRALEEMVDRGGPYQRPSSMALRRHLNSLQISSSRVWEAWEGPWKRSL